MSMFSSPIQSCYVLFSSSFCVKEYATNPFALAHNQYLLPAGTHVTNTSIIMLWRYNLHVKKMRRTRRRTKNKWTRIEY